MRVKTLMVVLLHGFLLAACGQDRASGWPTAPMPPVAISGTVYEHGPFGQRPLANIPLDVSDRWTYSIPMVVTDAVGRYSARGHEQTEYKARIDAPGYFQPCYAGTFLRSLEVTLDAHVVSGDTLVSSGMPSTLPLVEPVISGQVFERTPQGNRPISGASVVVDFADYDTIPGPAPFITTLTDSQGRYTVCGTTGGLIRVWASDFDGDAKAIAPDRISTFDFALVRR